MQVILRRPQPGPPDLARGELKAVAQREFGFSPDAEVIEGLRNEDHQIDVAQACKLLCFALPFCAGLAGVRN